MADLLRDNERVKELLELLAESSALDKTKDFSNLVLYVDSMDMQFNRVMSELQEVKAQLAEVQKSPVKDAIMGMVNAVESKIQEARARLGSIKTGIIEGAAQTLENVKHMGLAGLDKMVSFLGVRQTLDAMRGDLNQSVKMMENTIAKVGAVGQELGGVGRHLTNVGRVLAGKERQEISGKEGRVTTAILAPMRSTRNILSGMEKTVAGAIGRLGHLEQAAKKPSVLQGLKEAHKETTNKTAPTKTRKEAVL